MEFSQEHAIEKLSATDESIQKHNANLLKDKWKFLVFLILAQLGQQYNFQAVETVQVPLQAELGMDEKGYGYLIMAQSLPGLFIPFLSGYIVDHVGASPGFTGSIVLTLIGHAITTLGAYEKSIFLFIAGKVIFVIAYEATYLARIKLMRLWFEDAELNRANSYIILAQTTSVIICDVAYPNLYEVTGVLGFPFLIGAFISLFSVGMCVITSKMHRNLLQNLHVEKIGEESHQPSFSILRQFPPLMWFVVFTLTTGLVGFLLTKIYLSKFLQVDFGFSIGEAGFFLALSQLLSGIAAISAGIFADKFGKLPYISIAALVSLTVGIALNIVIPKCDQCLLPAVPIVFLSFTMAPLFIAGYGEFSRLIPEKNLGMATSAVPVSISLQMAILSTTAGWIAQETFATAGYRWVFALSLCVAITALICAFKVQLLDQSGDKILQEIGRKKGSKAAELSSLETVSKLDETNSNITNH